jgi:hypothetical protein
MLCFSVVWCVSNIESIVCILPVLSVMTRKRTHFNRNW